MKPPDFDVESAHRHFSADCFNRAWALIRKEARSEEEVEEMIRLSLASLWHWTERKDVAPRNLSIGYWQLSRAYAVAGRPDEARRYGRLCLEISRGEAPFYRGFANEALARAERVAGNVEAMRSYLGEARRRLAEVDDPEDRKLLEDDLATLD